MRWRPAARASVPLDLDWLMWFGVPSVEPENLRRVFLANLAAVVANYRDVGLFTSFFAGAVRDREEVGELEAAAGMPLRVVRLVVSRAIATRGRRQSIDRQSKEPRFPPRLSRR